MRPQGVSFERLKESLADSEGKPTLSGLLANRLISSAVPDSIFSEEGILEVEKKRIGIVRAKNILRFSAIERGQFSLRIR